MENILREILKPYHDRIEELEACINRLRNCDNCDYDLRGLNKLDGTPCFECEDYSNWKIYEEKNNETK